MSIQKASCPVCLSEKTLTISPNLYICRFCQIAYNSGFKPHSYDKNYFFDEYRNQYGKTYLDDYEHIYSISQKRLEKIFKFIGIKREAKDLSLLDVGSAAGFFLKCANDNGIINIAGVEISEYACDYCKKKFGIEVIQSSFSDFLFKERFDIVTAWFFIEHCEEPVGIIKKIYNIINEGGIFAFSAPSVHGPLFKFNREKWIETHPKDHRIDFSPKSVKRILRKIGFKNVRVKPAGFHPERIIKRSNFLFKPFSSVYKLFSEITAFSDTIEVYAVK